jgi:hypothetical protein
MAATRKGRFDVRQVRDLATEKSRIEEQLIVANAHLVHAFGCVGPT